MGPPPEDFGDEVIADHIGAGSSESSGLNGEKTAVVARDRASEWLDVFPLRSKTAEDAEAALRDFMGPRLPIQYLYSDGSKELEKAANELKMYLE